MFYPGTDNCQFRSIDLADNHTQKLPRPRRPTSKAVNPRGLGPGAAFARRRAQREECLQLETDYGREFCATSLKSV